MKNTNNKTINFSKGNRKLPSTTVIFNLPHLVTCPGATDDCKRYCYARKAETAYKQVLPYRYRNLEASKQADFATNAINTLKSMRNVNCVRIHESGDFYNQAYVDAWTTVAQALPNLRFTFYTKSYHLFDFSKLRALPNVTAFASIDPTTPLATLKKSIGWQHATVTLDKVPENFFECPGSCKSCTHCYEANASHVCFHKH